MTTTQDVTTTLRLPADLHRALKERVNADRSVNSQIVEAVEAYLKAQK